MQKTIFMAVTLFSLFSFAESTTKFSLETRNELKIYACEAYIDDTLLLSAKVESAHLTAEDVFNQFLDNNFGIQNIDKIKIGSTATIWSKEITHDGQVIIQISRGIVKSGASAYVDVKDTFYLGGKSSCTLKN